MKAAEEMVRAWQERVDNAAAELDHVKTGWALFKPERVAALIDEYATASRWVAYWQGVQ